MKDSLDNLGSNFKDYKNPKDKDQYDSEGFKVPKYLIEPQKNDKIYQYVEKEFYKDKD